MAAIIIPFEDAVGRDGVSALPPPLLEEFRRDFTPPAGRLLVAYDPASRAITGCAAFRRVDEVTCEVRRMVVNWGKQRRGLGRRLMGALVAEASRVGYGTIIARVPEAVPALAAFYDRLGFARDARRDREIHFEQALPAPSPAVAPRQPKAA